MANLCEDLVGSAFLLVLGALSFSYAVCMKKGHAFSLSHITYCSRRLLISFQTKHSLLIQCHKLMLLLFNFDLFLNLGFTTFNFAPNP